MANGMLWIPMRQGWVRRISCPPCTRGRVCHGPALEKKLTVRGCPTLSSAETSKDMSLRIYIFLFLFFLFLPTSTLFYVPFLRPTDIILAITSGIHQHGLCSLVSD
jgi:hypothetical protein